MFSKVQRGTFTFNDNDYAAITGVPGLSAPPVRLSSFDVPGANYGVYVQAFYGRRAFSLQGMLRGDSAADFQTRLDNLAQAFSIFDGPQAIIFTLPDGSTRSITAIAKDQPNFEPTTDSAVAASFNIPLEAAFPFLVSGTSSTVTLTLAQTGGGTVPASVPMSLSANMGGSAFVVNSGSAPGYPTARINGPITNPSLRNITSGLDVLFTLTLASGEYLDIDFLNKTVTDQSKRDQYASFSGTWWTLDPGTSEIRLVADSTDTSCSATLTYSDTYLSI